MTEAQSWVLIGIFASAVVGMMTWQTMHLSNLFRAELGRTRAEIATDMTALEARIDVKLTAIDRDVQALTRKVFGDDGL